MAHIKRKYIEKHWLVFLLRGGLATLFGFFTLFHGMYDWGFVIATLSIFLIAMGIIDAVGALYSSSKKHGWVNSVVDTLIDVAAAIALLFAAQNDMVAALVIIAIYTILSGLVDIFHGFLSTVDPTDRFIRVLAGILGCVIGLVILNAGGFEITTFVRFFGAYMLIVGVASMIYGVHNRSQSVEDSLARSEARRKSARRPLVEVSVKRVTIEKGTKKSAKSKKSVGTKAKKSTRK